jgi:hypothetical protein
LPEGRAGSAAHEVQLAYNCQMHPAFEKISQALRARSVIAVDGTPYTVSLIDIREAMPPGNAVDVVLGARDKTTLILANYTLGVTVLRMRNTSPTTRLLR